VVSEFLGAVNSRTFDRAVLALNVKEFLDKINFKPAEQYQAGLERVTQTHPPPILSE
jgi:hypothetical protein